MTEPRESLDLSEREASFIALLCAVAQVNGSVMTAEEISNLMSLNASADALEAAFNANRSLSRVYEMKSGLVIHRDEEGKGVEVDALAAETRVRKGRSVANIIYAKEFARRIQTRDVRLISVSGSTSYFSAKKDDDIDFFCVSSSGTVWLFLARALLMARLTSLRNPKAPELCFSCIMDDSFAREAFRRPHDALFARDAITAFVIGGSDYYGELLATSPWMEEYFPDLFRKRVIGMSALKSGSEDGVGLMSRVANLFLYAVVGSYVRMRSRLLNRHFAEWKKASRIFEAKLGPDHLMYESVRYSGLRSIYSRVASEAVSEGRSA